MGKKGKESGAGKRKFSASERREILRAFKAHRGPKDEFFRAQGITGSAVYRWKQEAKEKKASKSTSRSKDDGPASGKGQDRFAARKEAVEAYLKSGSKLKDFAKVWGVSANSLATWCKIYEVRGAKGLEGGIYGTSPRGRKGSSPLLKEQIVSVQKENPGFGLKKVRDFLYRFRGVKVSTGTVRKTVVEAKLPRAPLRPKKRKRSSDKIRRFERARAMQLWQSDITSFVLTRHSQRVYLTVFLDDHSRYIVAWSLQLRQKADLVMDALLLGIQRFGKPEEVLTDQGRQYFSWRGKSDFQKLLNKEGIRHVVARSHHPQTLGKCERLWETIGQEFWERVKPQELEDTRERLGHFIAHYNHFRPHQGIDGMTPADRFFGLAKEVRAAIEATLTENELRLAVGDAPRSPVFLVGQIGDQPVSLHGESGHLVVQTSEGAVQRLEYSSFGHAPVSSSSPLPLKGPSDVGSQSPVPAPDAPDVNSVHPTGGGTSLETEPESGRSEERKLAQTEKATSADAQATPGSDPHALGVGDSSGAGASPPHSDGAHGVLDGPAEQAGVCQTFGATDASSLAAVEPGDLGYGHRSAPPTEECPKPARVPGRSEEVETPDRGARGSREDAPAIDRYPTGDADDSRGDAAQGSGGEGNEGRSDAATDSREECKTSKEAERTQEELTQAADDAATPEKLP
jgi:transposase InsO family protein/transposase-like protein